MGYLPKISIVTPSFNQGQFLEQTILSVLGQNYPNLEYIIIDGGSSDNSVDVIKKYADKFAYWVSEPDNGQSHAINKGFQIATGDILCWLNSDDMFMPGILNYLAISMPLDQAIVLSGNCLHYSESQSDGVTSQGSHIVQNFREFDLLNIDFLTQPSTFWTRKVWDSVGKLNENLHFVFDWEWFIRAKIAKVSFISVDKTLSLYRQHDAHKTGAGGELRQQEIIDLYLHFGETENAFVYKNILIDKQVLNTKTAALVRYFCRVLRIRITDIKLLRFLFPLKYRKISLGKFTSIFYVAN